MIIKTRRRRRRKNI